MIYICALKTFLHCFYKILRAHNIQRRPTMILSLTAYIVIPIYTILFVSGTNWLTSNLSVIGNWPNRQMAFFFLGLIIGLYYHCILGRLLSNLARHKTESLLLHTALALLVAAVSTPYLPSQVPFQSFLQVAFAFVSSILVLICLYLTFWKLSSLSQRVRNRMRRYRLWLIFITILSGILLFIAGIVSSALEIFFIISTTILLQRLYEQFPCFFHNSVYNRR